MGPASPAPGGRRPLSRGLVVLAAVDALLVLILAVLLVTRQGAGGEPRADDGAGASQAPEAEATPEETAPEAPDDAQELAAFVLPSGNIWCQMTEGSATCTILQFTFTPPAVPDGCAGTVGNVLTVAAEGDPELACVTGPPPAAPEGTPVLEYGDASTVGEMTCHSSRNGATCRHDPSGTGFSVARAGYTLF